MRTCTIFAFLWLFLAMSADGEVPREVVEGLPAIIVPPGDSIPDKWNDEKLWQAWIEKKIADRGGKLPPEFKDVAKTFKRVGKELNVFWPGALVQSALETGFYQFGGDVPADKHGFNVAGVGITKEKEERVIQDFGNLDNGVRAFFQHLIVYSGEDVKSPIANRTKKEKQAIRAKALARLEKEAISIRFIDLGSYVNIPEKGKESASFQSMAKNYGGSVDKFRKEWQAYQESKIGGAALGYAGDPLYAWKWFNLWQDAKSFIEQQRIEFVVRIHEAWKRGPVSCSIQAKPPAGAPQTPKGQPYWNEPYLIVVQIGPHRGYYYPKNIKAYAPDGKQYYEDLGLASGDGGEQFVNVRGCQAKDLPDQMTVTAVFSSRIEVTQTFPLPFKGDERDGDQRAREKLVDFRRQYADRLQDPKKLSEALLFANHILSVTPDAGESNTLYAEALQILANQPKGVSTTNRRGALMHAHRRGAILRRDISLYMKLLDEIEKIGSVQDPTKVRIDPGHYLMGLVLAVQADNNVELAHELWKRFKDLARQLPAEHPRARLYQTFLERELTLPATRIRYP